jgi:DNA-binding transcriptional ArsR family regulator
MAEPASAEVLHALSHPLRLAVLVVLEQGELDAERLAQRVGVRTEELASHLAMLRDAGLVRDGAAPGQLRTSTGGWAEIDRQLRRLAASAEPPAPEEEDEP